MIETERLILRRWKSSDLEPFAAITADPEVGYWLGGAWSRVQAEAAFERMQTFWVEHGYGQFAIERKADRALIGRIGVRRMPPEWNHPMVGEVEVGWLLSREAWGRGYAAEGGAAGLAWGYGALGVETIHSWTAAINHRSEAVMRRIGMVRAPERDFEHPQLAEDHPLRAHVVYVARREA